MPAKGQSSAPKAAAKVKAAPPPKQQGNNQASASNMGMDPKSVSKMINFLKYRADPDKNKKGEGQAEAKAALSLYEGMGNAEKASFLTAFMESNPGKTKNWKFVTSYSKTVSVQEGDSVGVVSDFMMGPKILELNGLKWSDHGEQAPELLKEILADNAQEHGYEPQGKIHPSIPLLSKYFYVHSTGRAQHKTVHKEEELKAETNDKNSILASLESSGTGSSSSSAVEIKKERPGWQAFQHQLTLMKAAIGQLQRAVSQGSLLVGKFDVAGRKDAALHAKGQDLKAMMNTLQEFTNSCVVKVSEAEVVLADDENMKAKENALAALVNTASHHVGGYKEMYRRHQAMLG